MIRLFSKLTGGQAGGVFEQFIEIGDSIVSAVISDAGNGGCGANEHLAGIEDPYLIQVIEEMFAGAFLKPSAKTLRGKPCDAGNVFQGEVLIEIILHMPVDLAEPVGGLSLIFRIVNVVCNAPAVSGGGQDMQDLQQQQDPPESPLSGQNVELSAYFVPGRARDLYASGGQIKEAGQVPGFFQLIEFVAEYFLAEMHHYRAGPVATGGIVIQPDMGKIGPDEDHVSFFEGVDPVADDTPAMAFLDQDQLQLGMKVKGRIECILVPVDDGQPAVVQKRDLCSYDSHMAGRKSLARPAVLRYKIEQ